MDDEIKVSELPQASQVNAEDLLMIIQGGANKKITKELFDSQIKTSIEELTSEINSLKNELAKRDKKIVVGMAQNYTTNVAENIPFDSTRFDSSDGSLVLESNGVTIGAGIEEVEISAQCFFQRDNQQGGYQWTQIRHNGYAISTAIGSVLGDYGCTTHSPIPRKVQEGDKITIYRLTNYDTTIRGLDNTYMQIKVTK